MMKLAKVLKDYSNTNYLNLLLIGSLFTFCQKKIPAKFEKMNSAFDQMVQDYLSFDVPTITIMELRPEVNYLFIDTRNPQEYNTSTIKGAINIPNQKAIRQKLKSIQKDTPIIVFCSIGYRSEKMTQKLLELGYKNVNNLYGSIFEWANRDLPLYQNTVKTNTIHTYNRSWSKWINNKKLTKIW